MYPAVDPIGAPRRRSAAWVLIPLCLAVAAIAGVGLWLHNGLVERREAVDAAWAQVESSYQRRADLIPVLVETLKRSMRHEAETLEQVVSARGRALAAMGGAAPVAQSELSELAAVQAQVGQGIQRLLALAESYPELRSADQFLELQAQLEGSENRIHVARMAFNEAVRDYNAALEQLPTRSFAQARGYERRAYFQTDESNRHASSLGFD